MPSMEVQECPVVEVQRGHTHRHFSKPFTITLPKGKGQIYKEHIHKVFLKLQAFLAA